MLRWSDLPTNLETPFDQVDTFLTPTELFYIRSHFQAPQLDLASYQLRIDGAVRNPFSLSYKELRDMPSETRVATLECAGNGRVFLIPQVEGAQWELGAVGNAEWTGVPLGALLERAGMEEDACEIVLEGADQGTPNIEPKPPGPISYARSLPPRSSLPSAPAKPPTAAAQPPHPAPASEPAQGPDLPSVQTSYPAHNTFPEPHPSPSPHAASAALHEPHPAT